MGSLFCSCDLLVYLIRFYLSIILHILWQRKVEVHENFWSCTFLDSMTVDLDLPLSLQTCFKVLCLITCFSQNVVKMEIGKMHVWLSYHFILTLPLDSYSLSNCPAPPPCLCCAFRPCEVLWLLLTSQATSTSDAAAVPPPLWAVQPHQLLPVTCSLPPPLQLMVTGAWDRPPFPHFFPTFCLIDIDSSLK